MAVFLPSAFSRFPRRPSSAPPQEKNGKRNFESLSTFRRHLPHICKKRKKAAPSVFLHLVTQLADQLASLLAQSGADAMGAVRRTSATAAGGAGAADPERFALSLVQLLS